MSLNADFLKFLSNRSAAQQPPQPAQTKTLTNSFGTVVTQGTLGQDVPGGSGV